MSGIARSAHEVGDVIRTQWAALSDDMDIFSIDELTVSAAELTISDDLGANSPNEAKISTAQHSTAQVRIRVSGLGNEAE